MASEEEVSDDVVLKDEFGDLDTQVPDVSTLEPRTPTASSEELRTGQELEGGDSPKDSDRTPEGSGEEIVEVPTNPPSLVGPVPHRSDEAVESKSRSDQHIPDDQPDDESFPYVYGKNIGSFPSRLLGQVPL